ncbi:hypothetical protein ACTQ32_13180 [Roseburia faecis]|uniref:hypothetical protein n=1 Tax=Roseburia faecis TaxID=301302 RepID=UPI003F9D85CA
MKKYELAEMLYIQLKKERNIQNIVEQIRTAECNGKAFSIDEQLEIVDLIRQMHLQRNRYVFESVDYFLALVDHVEDQIRAQENKE